MHTIPRWNGIAIPTFELIVEGEELEPDQYQLIESITYESHSTGSDLLTIEAHDPNHNLIDSGVLFKGAEIRARGGWQGELYPWLDPGFVTLFDTHYTEQGTTLVTINCMDESFLMNRKWVKADYGDDISTFSELAHAIADEYDLEADGPDLGIEIESLNQSHETDIEFLERVAEENNVVVGVRNGKLYWEHYHYAMGLNDEQAIFAWKDTPYNLLDFEPRVSVGDEMDEEEEERVDDLEKEEEEASADQKTEREGTLYIKTESGEFELDYDLWTEQDWERYQQTGILPGEEVEENEFLLEPIDLDDMVLPSELDGTTGAAEKRKAPAEVEEGGGRGTSELIVDTESGKFNLLRGEGDTEEIEEGEEEDEDTIIQADLERELQKKRFNIEGRAMVAPDPSIKGGEPVKFVNLGKMFSGKYGVQVAEHTITGDDGYTLELDVIRQDLTIGEIEDGLVPPSEQEYPPPIEIPELEQKEGEEAEIEDDEIDTVTGAGEEMEELGAEEEEEETVETQEEGRVYFNRQQVNRQIEEESQQYDYHPEVARAQAILETGWVVDTPKDIDTGEESYNLFGIKADENWDGDSVTAPTSEYDEEQGYYPTTGEFRSYNSYEEAIEDYGRFIDENPRYDECQQVSDDPEAYAECLEEKNYATDPDYADKVLNIIETSDFKYDF